MNHFCDVCNKELYCSTNSKLVYCNINFEFIKLLNKSITYRHVYYDFIDNNISFKIITIPPFIFEMNYKNKTSTISKMQTNTNRFSLSHEEIIIVKLNQILDFPWNNPSAIQDKIKTYLVFS